METENFMKFSSVTMGSMISLCISLLKFVVLYFVIKYAVKSAIREKN